MKNLTGLGVVLAVLVFLTGCSSSKPPSVLNEKYHTVIEVTGMKQPWSSTEFKIDLKDKKKVYVTARDNAGNTMQNVTLQFKEKFAKTGMIIVEDVAEADIALLFGSVYMPEANSTSGANGVNEVEVSGKVGAAIMTGGLSLIGDMFNSEKRAVLDGFLMTEPMLENPLVKVGAGVRFKSKNGSSWVISQQILDFKVINKSPEVSVAVIDTLFEAWRKEHIVE
jgi:hypothetical protein